MFILNNENAFGFTAFDTNTGLNYVFRVCEFDDNEASARLCDNACSLRVLDATDTGIVRLVGSAAVSFVLQLVPLMQREISPTLTEPVYKVIEPVLSNATLAIDKLERIIKEGFDD